MDEMTALKQEKKDTKQELTEEEKWKLELEVMEMFAHLGGRTLNGK